ncbi:hypothetical protein [Sphingomonas sanxanigenens]|uniref:Biopolymer transporter ExbD n=1 Tax=Sphingomonas sanxanigenens DSM 19645 = NX02 TaxID=1123269 RepID=W0AHH2_9SPHN|nr:hypothetical protein [Sphingomonas sanxanigenens]AHE57364.1 hypothetical protein NX02_28975 [Sphingomonas sanxanigenens DSM 19645 = NX02]
MKPLPALALPVLLVACADTPPELVMRIEDGADDRADCRLIVEDAKIDPRVAADIDRLVKRYPPADTAIRIEANEARYRCIGSVIFALQRAGYQSARVDGGERSGAE